MVEKVLVHPITRAPYCPLLECLQNERPWIKSELTDIRSLYRHSNKTATGNDNSISIVADIRTVRDYADEYDEYLVIIARKGAEVLSMPYMAIPHGFDEDVLRTVLKKLNALEAENDYTA